MPYDQFVIENLAGDLLPESTKQQKIASGYNRLLQTTEEGGAQAKEYLAIYQADRVRNFELFGWVPLQAVLSAMIINMILLQLRISIRWLPFFQIFRKDRLVEEIQIYSYRLLNRKRNYPISN